MRLWHKDLIPVLPRQQLLGQWRECCAIMANIAKKGTPNHVLVNKLTDYPCYHFYMYAKRVCDEMTARGYRCDFGRFWNNFLKAYRYNGDSFLNIHDIFVGWHNDRYLTQCYYNLQEKYDCGAITDEEWARIEERYQELKGGNNADLIEPEPEKVDVKEIVICKDCKHSFNNGMRCYRFGENKEGMLVSSANVRPNGFCAWGERKDDTDDGGQQ